MNNLLRHAQTPTTICSVPRSHFSVDDDAEDRDYINLRRNVTMQKKYSG